MEWSHVLDHHVHLGGLSLSFLQIKLIDRLVVPIGRLSRLLPRKRILCMARVLLFVDIENAFGISLNRDIQFAGNRAPILSFLHNPELLGSTL